MESPSEFSREDQLFLNESVKPEKFEPIPLDGKSFATVKVEAIDSAPMYCRGCDYLLIGLTDHRCPECGTEFNPRNYATFFTIPRKQRNVQKAQKAARKFGSGLATAFGAMIVAGGLMLMISVTLDLGQYTQYVAELWLFHAIIAMPLSWPVILAGRARVAWKPWEISAFVIPFWVLAFCIGNSTSRHGNGEVIAASVISAAIPLAAWIRVRNGSRMPEPLVSMLLLIGLCGIADGAYVLFSPVVH